MQKDCVYVCMSVCMSSLAGKKTKQQQRVEETRPGSARSVYAGCSAAAENGRVVSVAHGMTDRPGQDWAGRDWDCAAEACVCG